jgi:hypothetical protein
MPFDRHRQLVVVANQPRIGRVERLIRRLLITAGRPMTTTELMRAIYPRPDQTLAV